MGNVGNIDSIVGDSRRREHLPESLRAIHQAAKRHDVMGLKTAVARYLVHQTKSCKNPPGLEDAIDTPNTNGMTALHIAAGERSGNKEKRILTVTELLKLNASTTRKDRRGFTVLHYAATTGDCGLINLLLRFGSKPELDNYGLSPADVLPRGSSTIESLRISTGFHVQVQAGIRPERASSSSSSSSSSSPLSGHYTSANSDYFLDVEVYVPKGKHGSLYVQVCHVSTDKHWELKRLPPLYKLVSVKRRSIESGHMTSSAALSLRVFGILANRKYRVLCERENGHVCAVSYPLYVSKESIAFRIDRARLEREKEKQDNEDALPPPTGRISIKIPEPETLQGAIDALESSLDALERDAKAAESALSPTVSADRRKSSTKSVRFDLQSLNLSSVSPTEDEATRGCGSHVSPAAPLSPRSSARSLQWNDELNSDVDADEN